LAYAESESAPLRLVCCSKEQYAQANHVILTQPKD
jgi:hypothetical protein